ncbi:MAG: methylenetetrahydrofolate reductase [Proteobacteria bacterium]|nr:methylenetetrahydrofolate reductase [Pseudomonadota bacterium]
MTTQNKFSRSLLDPEQFTITYELVPGQGSGGRRHERLLEFARQTYEDGRIKALSITDNAGGHPALAPIAIGSEVQAIGLEPLLHFSLKDKNRSQVESHLFLYHRQRFHNLLILGGDFPRPNYYGQAKPVFDLDSVQTLHLLREMEDGSYQRGSATGQGATFAPLSFLRGCVVSPFKTTEAEQVWQYAKLLKKIAAGANFIITQLGYDVCKFEELIRFLRETGNTLPVLGNVFIPSLGVAEYMGRGGVPGIVFPQQLIRRMQEEAVRQDTESRLLRAAKMICVLRGLGYSGVHLGGNGLNFTKVRFVLDTAEAMQDQWPSLREDVHFPADNSWYLYPPAANGVCGKKRGVLAPGRRQKAQRLHQLTHRLLFAPDQSLTSRLFGRFCRYCAKSKGRTALLVKLEKAIKDFLFSCHMCGDCTLAESTYLCPQAGCPKKLLNGPCGGSRNMACEVYPDRACFWVRVYDRLDPDSGPEQLGAEPPLPPKDWALDQTSSWINHFTGRDHKRINQAPGDRPSRPGNEQGKQD